jgi:hypothetical protein
MTNRAVEIFLSYSHEDEYFRDKLVRYLSPLKRQGVISVWHDRDITMGQEWQGQIDEHLENAQIILLLVSADYLSSDYCYDIEMSRAMTRHTVGAARVIPIILRPSDWMSTPFVDLQVLPRNAKPLSTWINEDESFMEMIREIRIAIDSISSYELSSDFIQIKTKKIKIFISYSRQDKDILDEFIRYLKPLERQEEIEVWTDQMILPGSLWSQEIEKNLNTSDIILILLSPAYLASSWLEKESQEALARHYNRESRIIPVFVNPTSLPPENYISKLQSLPREGKAVSSWESRDEAWSDVIRGLRNVIRNFEEIPSLINPIPCSEENEELSSIYDIGKIFRTSGMPEINYQEPNEFNRFEAELKTLGKGLAVEGPSGIGKTSTMRKALITILWTVLLKGAEKLSTV